MLEDWIALVSLLAELPHEVTDDIVRWAWSRDRVVTGRATGNNADAALHSEAATDAAAQLLTALQRVRELSDHDRQALQARVEHAETAMGSWRPRRSQQLPIRIHQGINVQV